MQRTNRESIKHVRVGTERNASFVVAVGDNFYKYGIPNVIDHRTTHRMLCLCSWRHAILHAGVGLHLRGKSLSQDPKVAAARFKATFEDVFPAELQDFRLCAGNHDHYGNVSAQVHYSAVSSRWHFPALFHDFVHTVAGPSADVTVHVLLLDTVVLAGHGGLDGSSSGKNFNHHRGEHGVDGSDLHGPVGEHHKSLAATQWAWLENALNTSTADFIIVAGHYPIYSVCEHGGTAALQERLRPLLHKYGVDLYFSGHDHCAEHISDVRSGVEHHGVGAFHGCVGSRHHAADIDSNDATTERFHWGAGHSMDYSRGAFALCTITVDGHGVSTLAVEHIDSAGTVLYSASAKAPRTKPQQN
eukprot:SAG31_NODE_6267_length_2095_cov_4.782064_1_plen_358_part_00